MYNLLWRYYLIHPCTYRSLTEMSSVTDVDKNQAKKRKCPQQDYSGEPADKLSHVASLCNKCNVTSNPELLQKHTSEWTAETLSNLGIKSKTTKLYSLTQLLSFHFSAKGYHSRFDGLVQEVKSRILQQSPLKKLDVTCVEEIGKKDVFNFLFKNMNKDKPNGERHLRTSAWDIKPECNVKDSVKYRFFERFRVHGEDFAQQLIHMSLCSGTASGHSAAPMYQCLFQRFASLLGLQYFSSPSLLSKECKVRNIDVTSRPDILFPVLGNSYDEMKVLAICKIKSPDMEACVESSSRQARGTKEQKIEVVDHMDGKLIGQHGKDLLLHLPSSYSTCSLLGMIIQKTYVTFSLLLCNQDQYETVIRGEETEDPPVIYYSKPYNYLLASDREELLEPILKLGFIQGDPYL